MFIARTHEAFIELDDGEEKFFRLPPMSAGPIFIDAFDAFTTPGPHGSLIVHSGPSSDLELTLTHSQHLTQTGSNRIVSNSLWFDDLWRLRVKRPHRGFDPQQVQPRRQYRIRALYSSQLPVLQRRVAARFFHEGFQNNWNSQRYLKLRFIGSRIVILMDKDLAALYGIQPEASDIGSGFVTFKSIETGRVSFRETVDVTSIRLEVGAGPHPTQGGNALYFAAHADFPLLKVEVEIPGRNKDIDIAAFKVDVRFYLTPLGKRLQYVPVVESNLLDRLDFDVAFVGNIKALLKKAIEDALFALQVAPDSPSKFGDFIGPWLVGGSNELFGLGYAPGAADELLPDGRVEPAHGELLVSYVGPRQPADASPVVLDSGDGGTAPPDDGAIRLFDVPDEDADPLPGDGSGSPFPGPLPNPVPNIGALAKIDHIVVLMQENRSFDQVLGYLRRDKGRLDVDGLLPPGMPGSERQRNRFAGREFVPTHADKADPPRGTATAWPSFQLPGPGHDSDDVRTQMVDDMGGFVANFAGRLGLSDTTDPTSRNLRLVMDYFDDKDLPVYGLLADNFAVCNHWYTAHAGPTWPNRFVTFSGELNRDRAGTIEVDNPDYLKLIPLQRDSLFDLLGKRGVPWRVYEHGYSFLRLFRNFTFDVENIVPFNDPVRGFEGAARAGALPPVTFIEPDYIDLPPGNDDHPPADMQAGQKLVQRIVQALMSSPAWERTLLVITYDEHGGFYDHVQPPADAPPLAGSFTKLGPRVPAFLVSPLVGKGVAVNERFDHTSIGATILRRFCGRNVPKVSPRMDAARDLRSALTRADNPRPRSDFDHLVFPPLPKPAPRTRPLPAPARRAAPPESREDFHGLLAAVRMTTGQAPKASGALRRKPRGVAGELLFYRDLTRNGRGQVANPSVVGLGGWHAHDQLFAGGNGMIYAVDARGRLLLYRDRRQDGTGDVATPQVLASAGWGTHRFAFSGGDGIVYAVDAQGRLLFHRHGVGNDEARGLSAPSVIGRGGWQNMRHVTGGGDGIIYAVDLQGRLLFYRDKARNGSGDVAKPAVIGLAGWQAMRQLTADRSGILYAVDPQGRLLFYRDKQRNGSGDVASPAVIGAGGWQAFKFLAAGGSGVLYAVRP